MSTAVAATTSYSPGLKSAAQLQWEVLSFFSAPQDDPELNTLARNGLNDGIDMFNSRTWLKIHGRQDITMVTAQADYALNNDFKDPIVCLRLNVDGNPDGRIRYKEYKTFEIEHPSATANGWYSVYTIYYDKVRNFTLNVAPTIDIVGAYPTLMLRYHRRAARLTSAGQSSGLPPEFDSWLVMRGAMRVALTRDPEMYSRLKGEEREKWRELRRDDKSTLTDWMTP